MRTILLALTFLLSSSLFSQAENNSLRKNIVFIEAFGMGIIYSINYKRVIPITQHFSLGTRAGFSAHFIVTPIVELNFLFGGKKHFLDTGFGAEFTEVFTGSGTPGPSFHIGYRYQGEKGLFFRVTPLLMSEIGTAANTQQKYFNQFYGGVSAGYSF